MTSPPGTRKTYLFFGYDHNGAFTTPLAQYTGDYYSTPEDPFFFIKAELDPNCVVIKMRANETIEQAVKRANIEEGSDVFLMCHGGPDGTFTWRENEFLPYSEFFRPLPEGVRSINLACCFGGTVQQYLPVAPKGALVQTKVSNSNVGFENSEYYTETRHIKKPVELFLEQLDNFEVNRYKEYVDNYNAKYHTLLDDHPGPALPTIIGIGGSPSKQIDLMKQVASIRDMLQHKNELGALTLQALETVTGSANAAQNVKHDDSFWQNVLKQVKEHLENDSAAIDAVFNKLRNKIELEDENTLVGAREKRIVLAIAACYLDQSGELDHAIETTKQQSKPRPNDPLIPLGSPHKQALEELFPHPQNAQHEQLLLAPKEGLIYDLTETLAPQLLKGNDATRTEIYRKLARLHEQAGASELDPYLGTIAALQRIDEIDHAKKKGELYLPHAPERSKAFADAAKLAAALGPVPDTTPVGQRDITATRKPLDLAFDEMFGTPNVITDPNHVGLDKLKAAVAPIVLAAQDHGFEKNIPHNQKLYAYLYQQWMDAPKSEKNLYAGAITILRRAEEIYAEQHIGKTLMQDFAFTPWSPQLYNDEALRHAKSLYTKQKADNLPIDKLYNPERDYADIPDVADDDTLINFINAPEEPLTRWRAGNEKTASYLQALQYRELTIELQQGLDHALHHKTPTDTGVFDQKTLNDIRAVQQKYGLQQNGEVNRETMFAIQIAELSALLDKKPKTVTALEIEAQDVMMLVTTDMPQLPPKLQQELRHIADRMTDLVHAHPPDHDISNTIQALRDLGKPSSTRSI